MILISNARDVFNIPYDELWYITNYTPKMRIGAKHVPELAPNRNDYIARKKGIITLKELLDNYEWELQNGAFDEPLSKLITLSEEDKVIQCVCYCDNYLNCHRYVLYKYLLGKGIPVTTTDF